MMTMDTLRSTLLPIDVLCEIDCEQDNPYAPMIRQTKVVVPPDKSRKVIMRNLMTTLMYHFAEGCLTDVAWTRDTGVLVLTCGDDHTLKLELK